jgi:nitroimidazol reductase NimA-like FMN-containing flavoprotein (pyridoxamine 5'-phosphate oxidase superfamily)
MSGNSFKDQKPKRATPIKRLPHKESSDRADLMEIITRSRVAQVAINDEGPVVIPVAVGHWHDGSELLLHGSTASRLFKKLGEGVEACVSLTLLDGLVLARSAFESSMNYKSLLAFGSGRALEGTEKEEALLALTEHLFPGRTKELRASTEQELKATSIVAFPLDDYRIKVSDKEPEDPERDLKEPVWAGVVPIHQVFGQPIPASNLDPAMEPPSYIKNW